MTHELTPQHQEVKQKATDRIKQSIARVLFKATEGLEPTVLDVLAPNPRDNMEES